MTSLVRLECMVFYIYAATISGFIDGKRCMIHVACGEENTPGWVNIDTIAMNFTSLITERYGKVIRKLAEEMDDATTKYYSLKTQLDEKLNGANEKSKATVSLQENSLATTITSTSPTVTNFLTTPLATSKATSVMAASRRQSTTLTSEVSTILDLTSQKASGETTEMKTNVTKGVRCDIPFNGSCYWVDLLGSQLTDRAAAQQYCEKDSGTLAGFHSYKHAKLIHQKVKETFGGSGNMWSGMMKDQNSSSIRLPNGSLAPNFTLMDPLERCAQGSAVLYRYSTSFTESGLRLASVECKSAGAICEAN